MKKLIVLFAVLFITTGVFGQSVIRDRSLIETIGNVISSENVTENFDWIKYIHFIRDGKLFMLSYEPKEEEDLETIGFARGMYLYSKDINNPTSPWKKASAVIMTNCYGSFSYDEVDFFLAEKSFGSKGKVEFKEDGNFEITIGWSLMNKVINDCVSSELKFEFVPNPYGRVDYLHQRVYK